MNESSNWIFKNWILIGNSTNILNDKLTYFIRCLHLLLNTFVLGFVVKHIKIYIIS